MEKMYIVIHNLYGIKNGSKAYYRKQGIYCFDFVGRAGDATILTEQECEDIKKNDEWFCKQYKASHMTTEE